MVDVNIRCSVRRLAPRGKGAARRLGWAPCADELGRLAPVEGVSGVLECDWAGGGPGGADVLPPIPLVSGAISHCRSEVQV